MNKILTFLGTGTSQGVPVISCNCEVCKSSDNLDSRLRSSVLITLGDKNILIDSGPDLRLQMLREKINQVDCVLYTHEHRDHVAGLDDLRSIYFSNRKAIPLYMNHRVKEALEKDYSYLFSNKEYFGKPKFSINLIENKIFQLFDLLIQPIEVMHYKLPVFGYIISDLAYITDANFISDKEKKKLFGIGTLIINCLQMDKHISHFNLEECLELIDLVKPKKTYLTHISHRLGFHEEIEKDLPDNVFLSYDGLQIEI